MGAYAAVGAVINMNNYNYNAALSPTYILVEFSGYLSGHNAIFYCGVVSVRNCLPRKWVFGFISYLQQRKIIAIV